MSDADGEWTPAPNLDRVAYWGCIVGMITCIVACVVFGPNLQSR